MRKAAALAILCLLAASCVKLERQAPEKHLWALEVERPAVAAAVGEAPQAASGHTLLVRRLQVSPRVSGRELVYRTAVSAWTADYYNQFFVAPADMLTQDLRTWLAGAGLYANVVDPGSLAPAQLVLEGNVTALYGDLSARPARAVAEMQFLLLDARGDERRVLLTRAYSRGAPMQGNTPQELVAALRQAVAGIYSDLEADLRKAVPAASAAPAVKSRP